MRKVFFFVLLALLALPIYASSQQAYQDYLFQFDLYRKTYSEFTIAKNEYEKFQSLGSQSAALEKTKAMMIQRNLLLRSYLSLLSEKIIENPGLIASQRQLYLGLVQREIGFLGSHSIRVSAAKTLGEVQTINKELETHYPVMQASVYQTITGLTLGNLASLSAAFDEATSQAQQLIVVNSPFPPKKTEMLGGWMLQVNSKRSLYQQKIDTIALKNAKLDSTDLRELERESTGMTTKAGEAKQLLTEATSFLSEVVSTLKYED